MSVFVTAYGCVSCPGADPGPYPREDKEAAREWFWTWWPRGHELLTGFSGSYEDGIPGETSASWRAAMETRLNTFRRVVGVGPVTTDPEYNRLCQAGAIVLLSDFSHAPAKTAKNWSEDGFLGCQRSLLTNAGTTWRNPVMDLIYDGGEPNLGHRSSMLAPGLRRTGFGAAGRAVDQAKVDSPYVFLLYNTDPSHHVKDPGFTDPFVLWPARGWIPTRLIPANWMVDVSDYWNADGEPYLDLGGCTIEAWRNGVKMPVGGGPDLGGFSLIFSMDGTDVNAPGGYQEGGSGRVVDGVQTPATTYTSLLLFGHDIMHGEISAYGQNAGTEDPFGDVLYDIRISGIRVRETGALWNGTGVYEYQVKGFDLQTPGAVKGQAKLINVSTRSPVRTGSGVQIAGFVVRGTRPRTILVRGSGPALVPFEVSDVLADPKLSVYRIEGDTKVLIGANDDWSSDVFGASEIEGAAAAVGAFPWTRGSRDAALVLTLAPGNYTGVVEGADGGIGNGLVEVYDVEPTNEEGKVVNLSSRTYVGNQGSDYQIAGFVLRGDKPRTVLIRVTGRDLERFGVTDVLNTPMAELYAGKVRIGGTGFRWHGARSDHSRLASASKAVGGFELDPEDDAAVGLFTLLPNVSYSVVVQATTNSKGYEINTQGNALVEVYEFP